MKNADFGSSKAAALGGKARAEHLSSQRRKEIARLGGEAKALKMGKGPVPHATHGSSDHPLKVGDIEIPCYVLDDKRRVLVQRGMMGALDMSQGTASKAGGGDRLAKFIGSKSISPHITKHLYDVITQPILFRTQSGSMAYGYEATILADLCDAVLEARKKGELHYQQDHIADRCEILVRGFARVGIVALVDEATGYQDDRDRNELAQILEAFVAKELRGWVRTFQIDFYRELFRLKNLPFNGTVKSPPFVGHLINDLVYARLAPGVLAELKKKSPRDEHGKRKNKLFQWLTDDIGHPKLKEHLASVTTIMKMNDDWDTFYEWLEKLHKKYKPMPLWDVMGVVPDEPKG